MRVIISGASSGFGRELALRFSEATAIGRSEGWDLLQATEKRRFAELTLDHDVFINYGCYGGNHQQEILQNVVRLWDENNKSGLIVNFGSICTFYKPADPEKSGYYELKSDLDEFCRNVAKKCINDVYKFRLTNLRLGYLQMEKNIGKPFYNHDMAVTPEQVYKAVVYLFESPHLVVPDMVIERKSKK